MSYVFYLVAALTILIGMLLQSRSVATAMFLSAIVIAVAGRWFEVSLRFPDCGTTARPDLGAQRPEHHRAVRRVS